MTYINQDCLDWVEYELTTIIIDTILCLCMTIMGIITIVKFFIPRKGEKLQQFITILTCIFFIVTILQNTFTIIRGFLFCFTTTNERFIFISAGITASFYTLHYALLLSISLQRLSYVSIEN